MLNILIKTILVCSLALNVYANVTSQVPQKNAINVPEDIKIQITFDNPIVSSAIKKNTIKLKTDDKKINGEVSTKDTNTLVFTPNENLKTGTYSLHVKSIKLINPEPIKPKTWFQRVIYKICSLFYSDVRECKLYNLFFGNNDIKTKSINYSFSVNDNIVTIETLNLETSLIELKENSQTNLTLKATYSNGTIKDITENIVWSIQDNSIVTINNTTLKALKEGTTTLNATVDNTTSNTINITVYKEINGYKLPPEPDETLNNSTLLGIDSNNNGVRDDVEIYVIKRFENEPKFPKTKTAIAMQYGKAYQFIMANDPKNAYENKSYKKEDYALDCQWFWYREVKKTFKTLNLSPIERSIAGTKFRLKNKIYDDNYKEKLFNTKERMRAYFYYNSSLSGHMFGGGGGVLSSTKDKCDFDIDGLGEM